MLERLRGRAVSTRQKTVADERQNGPRDEIFFGGRLPLKIYSAILHTKQRQRWQTSAASFIMDGRHPERPPRRAAQPISSADSGERSVAARQSWAAPGLSSGRFVVAAAAIYIDLGRIWKYPINQQEECFGGSVVLHMHRISSGIVGIERRGGEVVEQ